jgi:hypothetical protein
MFQQTGTMQQINYNPHNHPLICIVHVDSLSELWLCIPDNSSADNKYKIDC